MSKLTPEKKTEFLAILADGGSVSQAAQRIGISRQSMYATRDGQPSFAKDWDSAIEEGTDCLEDEAVRRAKTTSDTLLIMLLNGRRPEKFRQRGSVEHTGPNGGAIKFEEIRRVVVDPRNPNS